MRQFGRLIRSAVSRVGGAAIANMRDDVEQRVLLALWKQVAKEQTIDHPASYLYRAAVRETVRLLKTELGRTADSLDEDDAAEPPAATHTDADPHHALQQREWRAQMERCLTELGPDRERAVRAHLAGFDVREIMDMYGWSYQRARNLIARGVADLREALRQRGIHG